MCVCVYGWIRWWYFFLGDFEHNCYCNHFFASHSLSFQFSLYFLGSVSTTILIFQNTHSILKNISYQNKSISNELCQYHLCVVFFDRIMKKMRTYTKNWTNTNLSIDERLWLIGCSFSRKIILDGWEDKGIKTTIAQMPN